jgi:hypothetical protein
MELWVRLRKSSKETLQMSKMYRADVMSRPSVFRWWKCFKEENKMVIDDAVGRT